MTPEPRDNSGSRAWVERAKAWAENHTAAYIFRFVSTVATGILAVVGVGLLLAPLISGFVHPFQKQQEAIDALALQQTVEFVNSKLGEPQQSEDLCSRTLICEPDTTHKPILNIYRDEHYTVRAVFDDNSLEFFSVTLESGKFRPHHAWNYDIGTLGDRTYKQAFQGLATTEAAVTETAQSGMSYTEVTPLGAPGQYTGLVLASSPNGFTNLPLDVDAAQKLLAAQTSAGGRLAGLSAADTFRANSVPNTFGLFHDDGYVGNLLHDPQKAMSILHEGSNG